MLPMHNPLTPFSPLYSVALLADILSRSGAHIVTHLKTRLQIGDPYALLVTNLKILLRTFSIWRSPTNVAQVPGGGNNWSRDFTPSDHIIYRLCLAHVTITKMIKTNTGNRGGERQ